MNKVSRRVSLKLLGAVVLGGTASPLLAEQKPTKEKGAANPVDLAVARFGKGHSCSQAVFSAFAEQMGMDYQTAMKVSTGFGGGMGLGTVCGAVTGAIMAIGLKFGGGDPKANTQTAKLVRDFTDRFKAQHRSFNCPDLLGVDLSKPDGLKTAEEKKLFAVCPGVVRDAAKILHGLLNARPSS